MKIMIRSDMEGVTGVTTYDQVEYDKPQYYVGQMMMMNDLQAVIHGLLSTGNHEIIIYDEHTDGRNILLNQLDKSVKVICGKPLYNPDWGGIDSSFDAMIMVGFHARSGTPDALLPHTYSRKNLAIKINGQLMGEIAMEAAIAAEFGVPTILVTGDSAGMLEAREDIPGIKTVTVKDALGEFEALCYPSEYTRAILFNAAREVVLAPPPVGLLRFDTPVQLEITLAESDYLEKFKRVYPDFLENDNIVHLEGSSVTEVWSRYLEMYLALKRA